MFAIEHYGVEPDIMAVAKGIANGFPLSAFIAPDEIADTFQPGEHLNTFGGNPVSCAASLATINFLEREKIADQVMEKERLVKERLNSVKENWLKIMPKHQPSMKLRQSVKVAWKKVSLLGLAVFGQMS